METKFDPHLSNSGNYKFGIIYYNTNDHRIFVPKRNKYLGWTLNFGNHFTYLALTLMVAVIVAI